MFWVFVAEVPTGAVADYLGRKHSLFAGSILFGIGMIVYGITPSFVNFLLAEFILAIGCALISGADEALLYDSLKQEGQENLAKKIFGRAHTASLLGMMISAPIGGVIAAKWGLNFPTLLTSIPVFMAGIVAWSFVEPSIKHTVLETKKYTIIIKDGFKYFFGHPALRKLALVPLNPILGLLANKSLPWALITVSLLPLLIFAVPAGVVLLQKKKLYR